MPQKLVVRTLFHGNNGRGIRSVLIDGEPWFFCSDLVKACGCDSTQIIKDNILNEDLIELTFKTSAQNTYNELLINEPGFYEFVLCVAPDNVDNQEVENFKDFLLDEVIPSIRRNGFFKMRSSMSYADVLRAMADYEEEKVKRIQEWNKACDGTVVNAIISSTNRLTEIEEKA